MNTDQAQHAARLQQALHQRDYALARHLAEKILVEELRAHLPLSKV